MLSEVKQESDVLLQLNALELVSELASCPHGLAYLSPHLPALDAMLESPSPFLTPGLVKLFGTVARQESLDKYPRFQGVLLGSLTEQGMNKKI